MKNNEPIEQENNKSTFNNLYHIKKDNGIITIERND